MGTGRRDEAGTGSTPTGAIERAFPLAPLQEGMLYRSLRDPDSSLYHGQTVTTLTGALDEALFREAWRLAAERHEAFRTLFVWERRPQPVQVVLRDARIDLRVLDWTDIDPADRGTRWQRLLEKDRDTPIDLGRAPMMRFVLVRLGPHEHRLLWSTYHAVLDGWSARVVLREVLEDYGALAAGRDVDRPVPPSYARFVGWLESRDRRAAESYWRRELEGFRHPTPLPNAERGRSGERAMASLELSPGAAEAVRTDAARQRVTLGTMAVAAWAVVLGRHAGRDDVVLGLTLSERPAELPGVEHAAGLYLSTIPMRVRIPSAPVGDWLTTLQRRLSEARHHAAPGLAAIRRWSDLEAGTLVESMVVLESFPETVGPSDAEAAPLRASGTAVAGPSDIPLSILVHPGEGLRLDVEYDPAAIDAPGARALLDEMSAILVDLGGRAEVPAADLLAHREGATVGGDSEPEDPDVLALFEGRTAAHHDAVAIRAGDAAITYGALDRAAAAAADVIRSGGIGGGQIVGLLGERSPELIAGMLGALKAGVPYVVLDPRLPRRRLERLAGRTGLVLAEPRYLERLGRGGAAVPLPSILPGTATRSSGPPAGGGTAADAATIAYVVFTSGSTGEPKGVVVGRRELAWSTAARFEHYGHAPGSFLLLSPLSVDSSVAGVYWTLCGGGTLVLPEQRAEQDPRELAALVEQAGVTHTLLLPSLYAAFLEAADPARLRTLRWVAVAGESCPGDVVRAHLEALPGVPLHNEYGPSEATVWATAAELSAHPGEAVTIGRPVPGARVHLLEPGGTAPVATGEAGEICVGGPGVARGYLDRPALTAERFVPEPGRPGGIMYRTGDRGRALPDGRLEFLGRLDGQVKVRGYRVEPEEVEKALREYPGLTETVVLLEPVADAGPETEPERLVESLLSRPPEEVERLLGTVEAGR